MDFRINKEAYKTAKEIVIAKMSNCSIIPTAEHGQEVADYFNAIYKGILETTKETFLEEN